MSKSGSSNRRQSSRSKSTQAYSLSASGGPSSSQPFLNMINPMRSTYNGYAQANQSVVEEEEDENAEATEEVDLEAGDRSTIFHSAHEAARGLSPSSKAQGKQRVSWDPGASELTTLHPNIHKEDKIHEQESSDDEVPQSFKVEAAPHSAHPRRTTSPKMMEQSRVGSQEPSPRRGQALYSTPGRKVRPPVLPTAADKKPPSPVSAPPRPSELHERIGHRASTPSQESSTSRQPRTAMRGLDEYEKALWNWVNVYDLDAFLQEVYFYYEGKGIYSIVLSRGLNLITMGFVIGFSTFLLGCIDYPSLRRHAHSQLSNVIIQHCVSRFSGFTLLFFLLFTAFYVWQIISFAMSIRRLLDMYTFYTHLLKIPDADIQTISWSEVVRRIGAIREENPLTALSSTKGRASDDTAKAKLDAHDIANRIMRQENYLIALFNKELLDLRVPLPAALKPFMAEEEGKGKMLTQALEWNLRFCLMEYLFDEHGRVRKVFLKSKNRAVLIDGLRRRFIFIGILNAIFAPFIVLYLVMYSFFRYFEQYHKDPSSIGNRRYTLFAQWKFREFNELPHIFLRRMDESYPVANMYIGQFPNEKMTLVLRFVSFIAGSFAAVLLLATVLDPDLFLNFEITPHRTVFFYLGVFGAILTVLRGMIPEDNRVFDPELLMTEVINYTHYMPDSWKGELHSKRVHQEFGELFGMKILVFVQEILSVILTPFVLWFSLPDCAPAIVDFFREFSVHVDGRGYVCSFAEFNFERHGNVKFGAAPPSSTANGASQDKKMISNEGKMEKSFLNFKAANPDWNPTDPGGSLYLSRMADVNALHRYPYYRQRHVPGGHGYDLPSSSGAGHMESSHLTEKAQEYDHALRQSRIAAIRRRGMGMGGGGSAGSVMNMSTLLATGPALGQSVFVDPAMAASVALGDSHHESVQFHAGAGAVSGPPPSVTATSSGVSTRNAGVDRPAGGSAVLNEDMALDGGVGSGLGESYVDGGKRYGGVGREEEEEDGMEDGGVLGLLAQIYGRRDGPPVVI